MCVVVIAIAVVSLSTVLWFSWRKSEPILNPEGKYVLIIGCDSGFGRETAIRLDEMGVCVLATCLTVEGEQRLKSVTTDRLKTLHLDVTNSQQIQDAFEEVRRLLVGHTGKLKIAFFDTRAI